MLNLPTQKTMSTALDGPKKEILCWSFSSGKFKEEHIQPYQDLILSQRFLTYLSFLNKVGCRSRSSEQTRSRDHETNAPTISSWFHQCVRFLQMKYRILHCNGHNQTHLQGIWSSKFKHHTTAVRKISQKCHDPSKSATWITRTFD